MAKQKGIKPVAENRRARHDYFVEESYECGIALQGTEVKSMREGRVNLKESYATVRNGEVMVQSMHISPYEQGGIFNADPLRPKRLLLHKAEIRKLKAQVQRDGYTLIPLKVYLKDGRMKLELGVCQGKQLNDKRDDMSSKDAQRDIQRALRNNNRGSRDDCAALGRQSASQTWGCTGFDGDRRVYGKRAADPVPRINGEILK